MEALLKKQARADGAFPVSRSPDERSGEDAPRERRGPRSLGQIVLVFQGGGALGAYQVGVYEALHEAGVEPDWVVGTSIGAINAALIAGAARDERLDKLREFWARVEHGPLSRALASLPLIGAVGATMATMLHGVPAFFAPNPAAFAGTHWKLGADKAGFYSTQPLAATLADLIDFHKVNGEGPRLTVGAANVRSGEMRYFDSRDMPLDLRHVLASGALPPAFPAIRIDGELYWDGGILSNTPVEAVFDDIPRRSGLIFAVHIWSPRGPEPDTIWQVMNRHKDIQYSSRAATHIARQKQLHRLRHVIAELGAKLPASVAEDPAVKDLIAYGCLTRMHVVRLLAPSLDGEDHTKDIDFSPDGIRARWRAGYEDTRRVLDQAPWEGEFDPVEGFILHEARPGVVMTMG